MKNKLKTIGKTIMQMTGLLIVFFCLLGRTDADAESYEDGMCMIGIYDSAGNAYAIGTGFIAATDYGDIVITTTENYYGTDYKYYALTDYGSTSLTIDIADEDCSLLIFTMDQTLTGTTPFTLGYVSDLSIGDTVYALGYNFDELDANGNISDCAIAVESTIRNEELNDDFNYIELDNYMDEDTVGGPLLAMNAQGSLICYGVMNTSGRLDFAIEANYLLYTYSPEEDTDNADESQTTDNEIVEQTPDSSTTAQTPSSGTTGQTPSSGTTGNTPDTSTTGGAQTPAASTTHTVKSGMNSGVIWIIVTVAVFLIFAGIAIFYIVHDKKKKKAAYPQNNMSYGAPMGQQMPLNQNQMQQPYQMQQQYQMNQNSIQRPVVSDTTAQTAPMGGSIVITGVNGVYADQSFKCTDTLLMGIDTEKCNVLFPNHVAGVSGVHVRLRNVNGMLEVTDLNSACGTYKMDGTRLQPQVPYMMGNGEQFYLANPDNMFRIG